MLSERIIFICALDAGYAVILLALVIYIIAQIIKKNGQAAVDVLHWIFLVSIPIWLSVDLIGDYKNLASEIQCYAKEQYGIETTDMELGKESNNEISGTLFPSETAVTVFVDEDGKFTGMQLTE